MFAKTHTILQGRIAHIQVEVPESRRITTLPTEEYEELRDALELALLALVHGTVSGTTLMALQRISDNHKQTLIGG